MNRRELFSILPFGAVAMQKVPQEITQTESEMVKLEPGHYLFVVDKSRVSIQELENMCRDLSGHGLSGAVMMVMGDPSNALTIYRMES